MRMTLLIATIAAACSGDPTGDVYAELLLDVANDDGDHTEVSCETLPFLNGSRRLTEHVIDDKFTITVSSTPEEARLDFHEGSRSLAEALVIPRAAVRADYRAEIPLMLSDGTTYTLSIASGCEP